jgi:hypothetical protein
MCDIHTAVHCVACLHTTDYTWFKNYNDIYRNIVLNFLKPRWRSRHTDHATDWRNQGSNPGTGKRYFSSQKRPKRFWSPSGPLFDRYRGSCPGYSGRGLMLTPHLPLVSRLRVNGAKSPLPIYDYFLKILEHVLMKLHFLCVIEHTDGYKRCEASAAVRLIKVSDPQLFWNRVADKLYVPCGTLLDGAYHVAIAESKSGQEFKTWRHAWPASAIRHWTASY